MKKIFWIDGGAGRVIAAMPALIKYARNNPASDWAVVVAVWESLYWGIPELQDNTYGIDTKGLFENIIKSADVIITPEPYRNPAYFRQEISLAEAFDREINQTTDHSDLPQTTLVFNQTEQLIAKNTVADLKNIQQKDITVIFQPFGRGAKLDRGTVMDEESRSISQEDYLILVRRLAERYNIIFFGEPDFQLNQDQWAAKYTCDLRQWAALVAESDYFIGCDSVGQHMAKAVNTPGTVILGPTYAVNTSYPNFFQIIENGRSKKYSPIRIAGLDTTLANRLNERTMEFDDNMLDTVFNLIVSDIEKKIK